MGLALRAVLPSVGAVPILEGVGVNLSYARFARTSRAPRGWQGWLCQNIPTACRFVSLRPLHRSSTDPRGNHYHERRAGVILFARIARRVGCADAPPFLEAGTTIAPPAPPADQDRAGSAGQKKRPAMPKHSGPDGPRVRERIRGQPTQRKYTPAWWTTTKG